MNSLLAFYKLTMKTKQRKSKDYKTIDQNRMLEYLHHWGGKGGVNCLPVSQYRHPCPGVDSDWTWFGNVVGPVLLAVRPQVNLPSNQISGGPLWTLPKIPTASLPLSLPYTLHLPHHSISLNQRATTETDALNIRHPEVGRDSCDVAPARRLPRETFHQVADVGRCPTDVDDNGIVRHACGIITECFTDYISSSHLYASRIVHQLELHCRCKPKKKYNILGLQLSGANLCNSTKINHFNCSDPKCQ